MPQGIYGLQFVCAPNYDALNQTLELTTTATNRYEWDAMNRLLSITGPTNRTTFAYDGLGRRVQSIEWQNGVAISTNIFVWDGLALAEQRDGTGSTVIKRFFGQGEQISGVNYYFTRDHLGSIREMTDESGAIRYRGDYDPYGRSTQVQGDLVPDFGYAGMYYHAASGLSLTFFRVYDPDLGRWLSRDPIGEKGGVNLYNYVINDPINNKDPNGDNAVFGAAVVFGVLVLITYFLNRTIAKKTTPISTVNASCQDIKNLADRLQVAAEKMQANVAHNRNPFDGVGPIATYWTGGPTEYGRKTSSVGEQNLLKWLETSDALNKGNTAFMVGHSSDVQDNINANVEIDRGLTAARLLREEYNRRNCEK